ncbi:MAG: hypothetical protein ACOCX1_03505 [Fimbriimonadaceae bacterium]
METVIVGAIVSGALFYIAQRTYANAVVKKSDCGSSGGVCNCSFRGEETAPANSPKD